VWFGPQPGKRYIVAVDSAGGGAEGDFAAVQVVEAETGLQCAELQQRLRPAELAREAVMLAREYNEALLVVERNNHGTAVIAYVETSEGYPRLYRQGGETGWWTSSASKPEMLARLGSVLEHTPLRLRSRRLLAECRTFVAGDRGRTGAASGKHDDLVMAMAIAQAVRAEGRQ
jgi:phage terminase large subunit-like protein